MKHIRKVRVKNHLGLHTRPATLIVKLLQNVKCEVMFTYKDLTINAKSILSILMLAAKKNSSITITTAGEEAETILIKLVDAFENQFGEYS